MKYGMPAQGRRCSGSRRVTSAPKPDRVQVVGGDLVALSDEVLDVVVLGVEVATRERVRASRRQDADEPRRELGRRPGSVVSGTTTRSSPFERAQG